MKKLFIVLGLAILLTLPIVFSVTIANDDFECNAFDCGTGWDSRWEYTGGCAISGGFNPIDKFHMIGETECNALRLFNDKEYNKVLLSFYVASPNLLKDEHCLFYYNNGEKDFLLLDLTGEDIDKNYKYFQFDVTGYGVTDKAGFRFVNQKDDFCTIDNVIIEGGTNNQVNLFTKDSYILGSTDLIEMSSSLINTAHTVELYDDKDKIFCQDTIISPSSPFTSFFAKCTMPTIQQNNAYAKLYVTKDSSISTTTYFTVIPVVQNTTNLQIKKVYFSSQVLQGGSMEILVSIQKDSSMSITSSSLTLTFPDGTTRSLSLSPTTNENEYKALITDTYQIGIVSFMIKITSSEFYDSYVNQYVVSAASKINDIFNITNKGSMTMGGTEYSQGDPATIFLQLKDVNGNEINNGNCYLNMWYPANASLVHSLSLNNAPMLQAEGNKGIYYYDMVAPSQLGVYMLSATCGYAFNWDWYYPSEEMVYYPEEQINSGTWQGNGNPQVLNSKTDMLYERCDGTIAQPCSANYTFNLSSYGTTINLTNINVYFSGQSDTASRTLTESYWNGTGFVNLINTLAWSGTGGATPTAYDEYLTNSIPVSAINGNNIIKLKLTTPGSTRIFQNWLSLALLSSTGSIQDVKGSSEMHITNIAGTINNNSGVTFIGGTEYIPGDNGKITVRLVQGSGSSATLETGATCNTTILYPNSTVFVNAALMTEYNTAGVYYYNFVVPSVYEVYTYYVDCLKSPRKYYSLDTFHVTYWQSNLTSQILSINGSLYSLIQSVNSSLVTQVNNVNASLANQITSLSIQLTNINSSFYGLIINVNSTLYNQVSNFITTTNAQYINLSNLIISTNGTLYNQIANVNTSVYSQLIVINGSLYGYMTNRTNFLNNQILAVNDSLYYLVQNKNFTATVDFSNLTSLMLNINGSLYSLITNVNSSFYGEMININGSIFAQMLTINSNILMFNTSLNNLSAYLHNAIGSFTLSQIYSLLSDNNQRLINIAAKQIKEGQFSEEQIYLITDSITQLQDTQRQVNTNKISLGQAQTQANNIVTKTFSNPAFYTPNRIDMFTVDNVCVADITNEGKVIGNYKITMQIEGFKNQIYNIQIGPLQDKQVQISFDGLKKGTYQCSVISEYNGGTSSGRINVKYDSNEATTILNVTTLVENKTDIINSNTVAGITLFCMVLIIISYGLFFIGKRKALSNVKKASPKEQKKLEGIKWV